MSHVQEQDKLLTSLLVEKQVPEFVRDEHPLFITFLEAYYEFLENEQGTQNNDLTTESKRLRLVQDIDSSLQSFEDNFLNTFANLVPKSTTASKEFLIKNVLPLYLAKGSERSFKLAFRLIFGVDAEIESPGDQVLRASDSDFQSSKVLSISPIISTFYVGDGTQNIFLLPQIVDETEIVVKVNGATQTSLTDYFLRKEDKQIVFYTPPTSGSDIRVEFSQFNEALLINREVKGVTSNATVVIDSVFPKLIDEISLIELNFARKLTTGNFSQFEEIRTTVVDNETVINVSSNVVSSVLEVNVVDGGLSYNVGDPVLITAGGFSRNATAQVASVGTIFAANGQIVDSGAGFKTGGLLSGGDDANGFILYSITNQDTTGNNTPNTFVLMGQTYDSAPSDNTAQTYANLVIANAFHATTNASNTFLVLSNSDNRLTSTSNGFNTGIVLSVSNTGLFSSAFANTQISVPTVNSRIKHVVNSSSLVTDMGPISNVDLVTSNTAFLSLPLDGAGALVPTTSILADVGSFKGLGKLQIVDSGNNYTVGDLIDFDNYGVYGSGAKARVSETNANGSITNTEFEYDYYNNLGTGIRSSVVNIASVVANTGFNGISGVPNVYVSSIVVDAVGITQANINVGLSGVYMTPQSNHAGFNFHKGDNPVRIGDVISVLGHERKVTNVISNSVVAQPNGDGQANGMFHECGFLVVDTPFPASIDFLNFANGSYWGTRNLINSSISTDFASANVGTLNTANIFGAPMHIDVGYPKGGAGYSDSYFPNVSIFRSNTQNSVTLNSANATIRVVSLLGDGENVVSQDAATNVGKITTIKVIDPGEGYRATPNVDLTGIGDGTAIANAVLTSSVRSLPGRFTSSKGLLSTRQRKIQGLGYFQDFIYLTKVPLEFAKYKQVLKGLIHPAGYKNFAEFERLQTVESNVSVTEVRRTNAISGTINVSNSTIVVGTNTLFNIAVSRGTIVVGTSKLAVNGENRVISSVVSNTNLTVSSAFTQLANAQSAIILV